MKYPVYHAHKSTKQLIAKQVARFLAKPVAFTFVGMVLAAVAASSLRNRLSLDLLYVGRIGMILNRRKLSYTPG
jgi:hypothetical protein